MVPTGPCAFTSKLESVRSDITTPDDDLGCFVHRLDRKIDVNGRSNHEKVVLKRIQLEDRIDRFKKNLDKYKNNKLRI